MPKLVAALVISSLAIFTQCSISCESSDSGKEYDDPVDVCELYANFTDRYDKKIRLRAKVRGFHQILLFDPKCNDESHWIVVQISYLDFQRFYIEQNHSKGTTSDVSGLAILTGVLKRKQGNIPAGENAIYDPANKRIVEFSQERTVDSLIEVTTESYVPDD